MSLSRFFLLVLTFAVALALACSSESPTDKTSILGADQLIPDDGPDQGDIDPGDDPADDPDGDHSSQGTPDLHWQYVIDPAADGFYRGRDIYPTDDYGCLVLGAQHDGDERNQDIVVYKFDSGGEVEWTRTFAGSGGSGDYPYAMLQTEDGNYAFVGLMSESGFQICICKFDSDGDQIWRSPLGSCFLNTNSVFTEMPGGNLVVVGRYPSVSADPKMFVTNSSGQVQWTKSFSEEGQQDFRGVVPSSDGGLVLAKVSNMGDEYATDMLMEKVDANGDVVWEHSFGEIGFDVAMALVRTGNAYVMGGWIPGGGGTNIGLKAVDESGAVLWEATDNSSLRTECLDLAVADNGDLLVVGGMHSSSCGQFGNIMVSRFTGSGSMLWQKSYTQGEIGYYPAIAEAADGGILVVFDAGPRMHVMKLGANGEM